MCVRIANSSIALPARLLVDPGGAGVTLENELAIHINFQPER